MGYSGEVNGTWTLQQITSDEWLGLEFDIANYSTSTLTVNTSNSQLFNNQAGKTSHADICDSLKLFAEDVMPKLG